jgi:hypothetical protein
MSLLEARRCNGSKWRAPSKQNLLLSELRSMTLTKEHIRQSIENKLTTSRFESSRLIDSLMEIIKTSMPNGEDVLISGSGDSLSGRREFDRGEILRPGRIWPWSPAEWSASNAHGA